MTSAQAFWNRTHTCGELRDEHNDADVVLNGWVDRARDLGGLVFVDVRDRYGITQVLFDPAVVDDETFQLAGTLRGEFVIAVRGFVRVRDGAQRNANTATGDVEIVARGVQLLTRSAALPISLKGDNETSEELRLKHRYLDLRRPELQSKMLLRHEVTLATRNYFHEHKFIDVETPILTKSTPEGARDYLVPSRVHPGDFFALPQSPQLFKQILMISGYDRYMQIARCFRDEDLRADRQPEFTQVDIEMAFITKDILFPILEGWVARVWKDFAGVEIPLPMKRLSYATVMEEYGVDRPDLRFGLKLATVSDLLEGTDAGPLASALALEDGTIKALYLPGEPGQLSRKQLDGLTETAKQFGLGGLLWGKVSNDGVSGAVKKFLTEEQRNAILERLGERNGFDASSTGILLVSAGRTGQVNDAMSRIRVQLGNDLGLISPSAYEFAWVVDFPAFGWNEDEERWDPLHHPFTSPITEHMGMVQSDPGNVLTDAYDMVCNGYELGGGSIRIHDPDVQRAVFSAIGLTEAEARAKFGFLLDALSYGAPPHGGIAFGLDRVVMLLARTEAIREVIAFPKTQKASCLMTEAPNAVDDAQMGELHLVSTAPAKDA
ncbi:MAG: aspartate--tRNA ligase [Proteobacteria bacterium]|nr:aspartate--tRNA ligase [Pseudomonadota bacterium]